MNQLKLLLRASLLSGALLLLGNISAHASSATWNLNPSSDSWNTAGNWTPATVPNAFSDIATFDVSNQTSVTVNKRVSR